MRRLELTWPNWIGVVADDFDAQTRFYGEVLGLKRLDSGEDWLQFDMGWPNLLEVIRRSDQPQYARARYQVGFSVEDIEAIRRELLARAVEPLSEVEGGPESGGRWCYFRDPEGNVFEISQRVGEEW